MRFNTGQKIHNYYDVPVKDEEYEQIDEETLKRLKEVQKLSPENKAHVFALLDAFIKQTKLQAIM